MRREKTQSLGGDIRFVEEARPPPYVLKESYFPT